jgi:hypothetical protein
VDTICRPKGQLQTLPSKLCMDLTITHAQLHWFCLRPALGFKRTSPVAKIVLNRPPPPSMDGLAGLPWPEPPRIAHRARINFVCIYRSFGRWCCGGRHHRSDGLDGRWSGRGEGMLANSPRRHLPIVNVAISSHEMIQTIDSSTGSMVCTVSESVSKQIMR